MESLSPTLPHHPTYEVHMTASEVNKICQTVFPGSQVLSVIPLAPEKSFNNRIYFLKTQWNVRRGVGAENEWENLGSGESTE